jgi:hypothetical protein
VIEVNAIAGGGAYAPSFLFSVNLSGTDAF